MTPKEINRYLATHLMDWRYYGPEVNYDYRSQEVYTDQHNVFVMSPKSWNPYGRIIQALGDGGEGTVVGAMKAKGWRLSLHLKGENKFKVIFWSPEEWYDHIAYADTPSAATSLAAVEALKATK